jgi:hypothetical protein
MKSCLFYLSLPFLATLLFFSILILLDHIYVHSTTDPIPRPTVRYQSRGTYAY